MKIKNKEPVKQFNEIPWKLVTKDRLIKHGYSGIVIKAMRVTCNMTVRQLSERLRVRKSSVEKIENTPKIGIKLAKELSYIFKLEDWRILRKPPKEFNIDEAKEEEEELINE
jgi:hypothetical protein